MRYLVLALAVVLCGCGEFRTKDVSDGATTDPRKPPLIPGATLPQAIAAGKIACESYFGPIQSVEVEDGLDITTADRHVSIRFSSVRIGLFSHGLEMYVISHVNGPALASIEAGRCDVRGIIGQMNPALRKVCHD